ncbi:MAG TPA: dihydroorotase [Lachnospiraceae bacterium]|nr:dihydroorotase [Lachnospiraceae bacterium]
MKILIKNGRLVNPATKINDIMDILIEDDKIIEIRKGITAETDKTINAEGKIVTPGFIDVHVHLRDPGFEYKETIKTGSMAAVMGGFTTICCMPNTEPVIDSEIMVEYIKLRAKREAFCNVLPIGAITKGQNGEELANIGKMINAGACGISEDGKSVLNAAMLKTAMNYSKMFNIPVMSHCEDKSLVAGGVMNAGSQSQLLGLKGISNDSEDVIVARDIILAKSTGAKLHLCHVSTKGAIDLIRDAQARGQQVSAEICPHHFTLSDMNVVDYDANTKMNPPLRSSDDVMALREALKDDTVGIIATDHAPHGVDEKNCEYDKAAFGIVGLETAFALGNTVLVEGSWLTIDKLIEKMTINPAKLLGIDKGSIEVGKIADIAIIDQNCEYEIDAKAFKSKGKNTPFDGYKVKGKVLYTLVGGKIKVEEGNLNDN